MTESEWLACRDPLPMMEFLRTRRVSARSLRLLGAACCRRAWPLLHDGRSRRAVEVLEQYADGPSRTVDREELRRSGEAAHAAASEIAPTFKEHHAALTVACAVDLMQAWEAAHEAVSHWLRGAGRSGKRERNREAAAIAELVRDVIASPFGSMSFSSAWLTPDVVALASGIYAECDFDRMPILADALQDAGCDNTEILNHCRGSGPHARGCWVVDVLTERDRTSNRPFWEAEIDATWLDRDYVATHIVGVEYAELAYVPGAGLYFLGQQPFSGVSLTRSPEGQLRGVSHLQNGLEQGVSVGWYGNGQAHVYNDMQYGVCHGWHLKWAMDGTLQTEERCVSGQPQPKKCK